jgi:hypothetical protein
MHHERVLDKGSYDKVNVAAVWPSGPQVVHLPAVELEMDPPGPAAAPVLAPETTEAFAPTPAAPDVPAAVGGMIAASYAALIGAFFLATAGSAQTIYPITISALFVITFFTVPRIFFAVEPRTARRTSLDRFMRDGMETLTGHSTGPAALVQMLIVPVFLTCAALAMGVAAALMM